MSFFQPDPDAKPPTYTTATITVSSVPPTSDSERAPLLANRHYPAPSTATIENSTSQATLRQQQDQWTPPPLFFWVQLSLLCCVFLAGFDGTVTASTCAAIGSSFGRADMASWITTAYLLTATAIQPLYGRLSDIFGRRSCLLFASLCFATGCLGCASARDMVSLALSRAVTGVDGGGLMTMATITNSDLIPSHKRGLYQAAINVLHGVGSISGASLGGVLADSFGWRTCFAFQVPIALVAVWIARWAVPATSATAPSAVRVNKKDDVKEVSSMGGGIFTPHSSAGEVVEYDTEQQVDNEEEQLSKWNQVDFLGAALLVAGLGTQLAVLSLGGNELPWASPITLSMFVLAMVLLMLFIVIEARTDAVPIMPLRIMSNPATVGLLVSNVCLGMVGYGVCLPIAQSRASIFQYKLTKFI